ncbi:GntR family transcriptional regulator [Kineosporia succinea]|uniref:DNA-binding GntR family transcriptional regulator n=1 Tax=Kineosporia succinea TaxID=84632 RepID=A0ABT9P2V3_9ACTN|nr:GntR family transcriptional regulator [Kineosporia succinea]MDP9826724.1 DNA-binding GntR family transcriptional regulator [Kineosporia succinea]
MTLSAADRVYQETKELILSGDVPPGRLISEGDVAQRMSVSRTPVREAFVRLQGEDLLELIPKRGAVVTAVPVTEAMDVLETRAALETAAVRRMSNRNDDVTALMATMAELVARQREAAAAGDIAGFAQHDVGLHAAVVSASGNRLAERFYATLADRQRRMNIGAITPDPGRMRICADEHEALAVRIRERDVAGYESALRAHLSATHLAAGQWLV